MMWPLLQLDSVAKGRPCGSSAYPLDQRHLSKRVEGGWLILQQSLNLGSFRSRGRIACFLFRFIDIRLRPSHDFGRSEVSVLEYLKPFAPQLSIVRAGPIARTSKTRLMRDRHFLPENAA